MPVEVEIRGLDKLKKYAEKYPAISKKEIDVGFFNSLTRVWGEEKKEAPVYTGAMRDRWTIHRAPFEAKLTADTEYALYVHDGTVPHFPPREYVEPWANKHGIPVFLVQRAIARRGTKANKFLDRAVKNAESGIDKELQDALDRIVNMVE